MTITIRALSTIKFIGLLETNTIGYYASLPMRESRGNHWLPGREAHPEGVQAPAACHHQIANALLPQADPVFDDAAALDTAVHVLGPQPARVQGLVGPFLFQRQLLTAWCLGRHQALDLGACERQEAQSLQEAAPDR